MARTAAERNLIFQQRHAIFVEEYRYFAPRCDGNPIESDGYDDYAVFFGVWENNVLIASCRLVLPGNPLGLPTLNGMVVDPNALQKGCATGEISRISVDSGHRLLKKTIRILQEMQKELCRFASEHNIPQLIGAVEPAFLRLLHYASLPYSPFGPLQYHIGAERYPVVLLVRDCTTTSLQECS